MAKFAVSDLCRVLREQTRKRSVYLEEVQPGAGVEVVGDYWDGGSKSHYYMVKLGTGSRKAPEYDESAATTLAFGDKIGKRIIPEPGWVVVKTGTFCGKPATPTFYVRRVSRGASRAGKSSGTT